MLRFWKVTLANLKIRKLPVTLATSNFQLLIVNKLDLKSSKFETKIVFQGDYHEKTDGSNNAPHVK